MLILTVHRRLGVQWFLLERQVLRRLIPNFPRVNIRLNSAIRTFKKKKKTRQNTLNFILAVYGGTFQKSLRLVSATLPRRIKRRWQEADLETVCSAADNGAIAERNRSGIGAVRGFAPARPICSVIGRFLLRRRALGVQRFLAIGLRFCHSQKIKLPDY